MRYFPVAATFWLRLEIQASGALWRNLWEFPFSIKLSLRAYLRFTDDTASEIQEQLKSEGIEEAVDSRFAESWNPAVAGLAPSQSLRIMLDLLSTDPLPFFYAMLVGDSVGAFDVMVDPRREEEVAIGQPHFNNGAPFYDVWASFRSENAPPAPLESFAPVDYRIDSTIATDLSLEAKTVVHLKTVRPGDRLVPLELSRKLGGGKDSVRKWTTAGFFSERRLGASRRSPSWQ